MRALALPMLAMLAAGCSGEREAAPTPTANASTPPAAVSAVPRTMVAADLDPADLGPRIADSVVTDAPIGSVKQPLGRVSAYVACPSGIAACDPATLPTGTRYTYVITLKPESAGAGANPSVLPEAGALSTVHPAPGFQGAVGYALAEAAAALGRDDAIAVTLEQGRIVWRVAEGSRWLPGKPITVWWQSTQPPAKSRESYEVAMGGETRRFAAPFPAGADEVVAGSR